MNSYNVVMDAARPEMVSGILDFGDMIHSPLICDVAIGAVYRWPAEGHPLAPAARFVAGYQSVQPLEAEEIGILFDLIRARLASSPTLPAGRRNGSRPSATMCFASSPRSGPRSNGWTVCRPIRPAVISSTIPIRSRCPCPSPHPQTPLPTPTLRQAIARWSTAANRLLGPAYRLFYEHPVHLVRGEGVWLFDQKGRPYLDVYNNVPVVGHCHPRVVEALSRQAATLNTHTRYLHESVLDLRRGAAGDLPGGSSRQVMFTCTGSEANDLAVRVAKCVRRAAPGSSSRDSPITAPPIATAGCRRRVGRGRRPCTAGRGGTGRSRPWPGPRMLSRANVAAALERWTCVSQNIVPAALMLDSVFSSDGIFFIRRVSWRGGGARPAGRRHRHRRRGPGRLRAGSGRRMWGFASMAEPDIVTMGKPIGDGHPVARRWWAAACLILRLNAGYFNTFGGNPVSAAVGARFST